MSSNATANKPLAQPKNVYSMIQELNEQTLSNRERWVISEVLRYPSNKSIYDPEKQYAIWPSVYELGQIYELRQVMYLFFSKMPRNENTEKYFRLNTIMTELVNESIKYGYTYRYHDPNEPEQCFCYYPELHDEFGPPEICRNCAKYTPPPVSDTTTDKHFHIVPYPQRLHMNSNCPRYLWVLAFLLEGYEYDFLEMDDDFIRGLVFQDTTRPHKYFWFYSRYDNPTKQNLYDYQEIRTLYGEQFEETAICPKPTPNS